MNKEDTIILIIKSVYSFLSDFKSTPQTSKDNSHSKSKLFMILLYMSQMYHKILYSQSYASSVTTNSISPQNDSIS